MSSSYDLREFLSPKRLAVAMWDFSWLMGHYAGGPFDDFDVALEGLRDRHFNTVRIDCFPFVIDEMHRRGERARRFPAEPMANWGISTKDADHAVAEELVAFMDAAKRAGVSVILSSWGRGNKDSYRTVTSFAAAWRRVLDLLGERDLIDHVLYVDLDQEFPFFSPFARAITNLAAAPVRRGGDADLAWNSAQLDFVKAHVTGLVHDFWLRYPRLRFTLSLTSFFREFRHAGIDCLDVLEVHNWIHHPQFDVRTGFPGLTKDRNPTRDYTDYGRRLHDTMRAVRPMLMKRMHNRMAECRDWAESLAAPLVTTEAWGPWWHMDHPDLDWDWLSEWCEECLSAASQYGYWGATPWNYSHPYWQNWADVEWYRRVNDSFLSHP